MDPDLEPLPTPLARLLLVPERIWSRLVSPAGQRLVTPALAAVVVLILWRAWRLAGWSALGRAFRWHAVFVTTAIVAGLTLYVLAAPPDDGGEEAVARVAAAERPGRQVYTTPLAAAGALAVGLSTFAAARAAWRARVPAADHAAANREWHRLRAVYGRRLAAGGLAAAGGIGVACAAAVVVGSCLPYELPEADPAGDAGSPRPAWTGSLWVGTRAGASRLVPYPALSPLDAPTSRRTAQWEQVRRPWAPLPSSQVNDVAAGPDGEVWIATDGGLLRYDASGAQMRAVVENAPLPYPTVLGVAVDRRGVAWSATVAGAAAIDPQLNGRAFSGRTSPLMHQLLDVAFVDRAGKVWFGGAGGVNVYEPPDDWRDPGRWPAGFNRWSTGGGLPDNLVFAILEDSKGRMWFGTDAGAAVLTPDGGAYALGTDEPGRWLTFATPGTPLVNDKVHAIAEDARGRVYLGTERGLSIYDESAPADRRWSAIEPSRLPDAYVDALAVSPDGRVWIGTKRGLAVYDPRAPQAELPVYRANPLRHWTGLFWAPHARLDLLADEITALAWAR